MVRVIEDYRSPDGLKVGRLLHYRCAACGTRLFDEEAIHTIQSARTRRASGDKLTARRSKHSLARWKSAQSRDACRKGASAKAKPKRLSKP